MNEEISQCRLFVVGDRHAMFWQGATVPIAGIETYQVSETYELQDIVSAIPPGYAGWLLLSFSLADYAEEILRDAHESTIEAGVALAVERYADFVLHVKSRHPKLAVWGPLAAQKQTENLAGVGNVLERNLVILLFTSMLRTCLAAYAIPVLSIAEEMIAPDGSSLHEYLEDDGFLSQAALPSALRIVGSDLGLHFSTGTQSFSLRERRVDVFEHVGYTTKNNWQWLQMTLPGAACFITKVFITQSALSKLHTVTIGTSVDKEKFIYTSRTLANAERTDKYACTLPVEAYAKTVIFSAVAGSVNKKDLDVFAKMSPLSSVKSYSKVSLFSLRDDLLQRCEIA